MTTTEEAKQDGGGATQLAKYNPKSTVGNQLTLKGLMQSPSIQQAIKELAPKHLPPERLARMVITACSRQPLLLQCTQESILKGAIEASTLGLDCSGLLGRGYLIPYKNGKLSQAAGQPVYEAQFMPGYLGLCDLARRSGEIGNIYGTAVFADDTFEYEQGSDPKLVHKPSLDPKAVKNKSTLRFVYAVAHYKAGGSQFVVMTLPEIERHRERSRAKDSGPWVSDYIPMAIKTAVRQLCKWLPLSAELMGALEADDRHYQDAEILDGRDIESRTDHLLDRLSGAGASEAGNAEVVGNIDEQATDDPDPMTKAKAAEAKAKLAQADSLLPDDGA